jgi:hypothetical protein
VTAFGATASALSPSRRRFLMFAPGFILVIGLSQIAPSQHGTFAHCGTFTPEESHVPGFLWLPRSRRQGPIEKSLRENSHARVSTLDLFPTLVELTKGPTVTSDGVSLTRPASARPFEFNNCASWRKCSELEYGVELGATRYWYGSDRTWRAMEVKNHAVAERALHAGDWAWVKSHVTNVASSSLQEVLSSSLTAAH